MADTERLILRHRCSPRSLMLHHQKIYCVSLCAAFCWPYGKELRRQAKMTLVEVCSALCGASPALVWPASLVAPPLSLSNRKRAVRFGEGGNRCHHGSRTYSKYRREHVLINCASTRVANAMIHSNYAS